MKMTARIVFAAALSAGAAFLSAAPAVPARAAPAHFIGHQAIYDLALKEAHRVLKPGSRFLCLEFSTVDVPGLDKIYDLFSFKVIPHIGRAVTGDAESYQYLVESIRKFPKPEQFATMIRDAGFARVSYQMMSGGIVALHSGWRL